MGDQDNQVEKSEKATVRDMLMEAYRSLLNTEGAYNALENAGLSGKLPGFKGCVRCLRSARKALEKLMKTLKVLRPPDDED